MKNQHSPGPWTVSNPKDPHYSRAVSSGNGYADVAFCGSFPLVQAQANARLIAAAPDLLAALLLIERICNLDNTILTTDAEYPTLGEYARAAIAKAVGPNT